MKPTSCAPFGLKFNPTHRFGSLNLTGEPHILCQISTSIPSAVKVSPKTHVTRLRTSKGAAHTTNCFIISYISKYSAIQDIATWNLNHYLAKVDLTFPGGRNLFLSGYLHRGASEIFTMAAVGVEAWLGYRYHQVTWVVSAE